jgi:hypothetical protein
VLIVAGSSACVLTFPLGAVLAVVLDGAHSALFWSVVVGSALIIFSLGVVRIAVEADENEIVVRNLWRTHRIRWTSVASIVKPTAYWPGSAILTAATPPLRIETHDGRRTHIDASVDNSERVARFLRESSGNASGVQWGITPSRS